MIGPDPTDDTMATIEQYVADLLRAVASSNIEPSPERDDAAASVTGQLAPRPDGLGRKYHVLRLDGADKPGEKHHDCALFVLDLTHDPAARVALIAYCAAAYRARPRLTADLIAQYLEPKDQRP